MALLDIVNLNVDLPTAAGLVKASSGICLKIDRREAHCLIGGPGCGKTVVALGIMRLLPVNARTGGQILFRGMDLLRVSETKMKRIRGRQIAMIFEQPETCFSPAFSVGLQIAEAVRTREKCSVRESRERAMELMARVKLPATRKIYRQYLYEYSKGMARRAMIAMALASRPALLIADEPATGLDVAMRCRILAILKDLTSHFGISLLLITHDLEAAFFMCDRVSVMYAGFIVEKGPVQEILQFPRHPYTKALIRAMSNGTICADGGMAPELTRLPAGCPFHPRCDARQEICLKAIPSMARGVRCHLYEDMRSN